MERRLGRDEGDWNRLLLELDWDGESVTGTINPGPDAVPLQKASLDPSSWILRFEAEAKDPSGKSVRYVVEGKLEESRRLQPGAQRYLEPGWREGRLQAGEELDCRVRAR